MERTIEYILEVARCGGIAKAARNLYITPSALSKFILQKERSLGVPLFYRDGNRFSLTDAGEKYVEMLRELQQATLRIDREMASLAAAYAGHLRIGFQASYAELVTSAIVPAMQQRSHTMQVTLEENHWNHLTQMLLDNQLDVALTLTDQDLPEDLQEYVILTTPVIIAASEELDLIQESRHREDHTYPWLSDETLAELSWILDTDARSIQRYAPAIYRSNPASSVMVRSSRTALMCVRQNMGIIAIPQFLAEQAYQHPSIQYYSFGETERRMKVSILYNKKNPCLSSINTFIEATNQVIQKNEIST